MDIRAFPQFDQVMSKKAASRFPFDLQLRCLHVRLYLSLGANPHRSLRSMDAPYEATVDDEGSRKSNRSS